MCVVLDLGFNLEVFIMDKVFDLNELAKYNGKDGNEAYVAIDGVVYDVTNIKGWKNGEHHGLTAGKDLSEAIERAPHKKNVLKKLSKVGVLK